MQSHKYAHVYNHTDTDSNIDTNTGTNPYTDANINTETPVIVLLNAFNNDVYYCIQNKKLTHIIRDIPKSTCF